ncbi:MAG: zinc ribbon domain-containing protein [Clostridium sp.]|nr:zinc ribbon domain-containing protein [Prevotella sp.]MCM1428479.1 zinc ribbon domain-containing protein [Clostridium sp.]MCM1475891.1 zinc ribbon domain-containing protein [Muribaculaceae bacterium]
MRCSNCGWLNEPGATVCTKCNSPLLAGDAFGEYSDPILNTGEGLSEFDNASCPACGYPLTPDAVHCPACGQALRQSPASPSESIPSPAAPITPIPNIPPIPRQEEFTPTADPHTIIESPTYSAAPAAPAAPTDEPSISDEPYMGTINPWSMPQPMPAAEPSFTLEKKKWSHEQGDSLLMEFTGRETILNRANTDPENNSITSRQQARISFENGEWNIENLSDQATTLIRVDRKTPLRDGDVIILGNRMFTFRTK